MSDAGAQTVTDFFADVSDVVTPGKGIIYDHAKKLQYPNLFNG